ncbi:MAG: hypothetical protein OXC26_06315 [Albidovulum sp.]|nr:hypothetical protein [Albidovulum sp.]
MSTPRGRCEFDAHREDGLDGTRRCRRQAAGHRAGPDLLMQGRLFGRLALEFSTATTYIFS